MDIYNSFKNIAKFAKAEEATKEVQVKTKTGQHITVLQNEKMDFDFIKEIEKLIKTDIRNGGFSVLVFYGDPKVDHAENLFIYNEYKDLTLIKITPAWEGEKFKILKILWCIQNELLKKGIPLMQYPFSFESDLSSFKPLFNPRDEEFQNVLNIFPKRFLEDMNAEFLYR